MADTSDLEYWNYWIWNAFHKRIYSKAITTMNIIEGDLEFYESVFKIEDNQIIQADIPEEYREVYMVNHHGVKYVLPTKFAKETPLIPSNSFKCQLKRSDKKVWNFITGIKSLSISSEKYHNTFKDFIDDWNPLDHTDPMYWTLLKLIAFASEYKGVKLCISSKPNTGKNANFTIMNKILNNIGRYSNPTLAVFEKSLYYNQTTIIDEITSMSSTQLKEIEPVILTISDNSPDYTKHSLTSTMDLLKIDLSNKSIIFPYNRKQDVEENGGTFFDEVWNNISAFRSRFPQFYFKGDIITHFKNYNMKEAEEILDNNFDVMRQIAKETKYWLEHLHKLKHNYELKHQFTNRHLTNLEGLFDVIDVYSDNQNEFDEWVELLVQAKKDYWYYNIRNGNSINDYNKPEEEVIVDE